MHTLDPTLPFSPDELSKLVASVPHLVWTCAADGACDYLSRQWIEYTGRPARDQLGYGWMEAIHPEDRDPVATKWDAARVAGEVFDTPVRIRRHDGGYRWFQNRAVPERGPDGQVVKWYGTSTDIQELMDARDEVETLNRTLESRVQGRTSELERANGAIRNLVDELELSQRISKLGSWSFDLETGVVRWTPELFRILRLPVADEAPPYETHHTLFAPDSWARLEPAVAAASTEGIAYELELRLADGDEGPRWAVARGAAERDAEGRILRLHGTFQDVTDLVRDRRRHEILVERSSLAFGATGIGVWEWDIVADSLHWSPEMYRLYGVDPAVSPRYATWRDNVHPDDRDEAERAIERSLQTGEPFLQTFRRHPDVGPELYIRGSGRVYVDDRGRAVQMIGVNWDVTNEIHAMEARSRLRAQASELERSNADLQQFAYAASHDLQEPLRAVAGCAQILQQQYGGRLDAGADELITHMVDGSVRMKRLIEDLLAYSRVGTHGDALAPVSLRQSLDDALANLKAAVEESSATLDIGPLPDVLGDRGQLGQLWQNIIGNAIKYAGASAPRIVVRAESTDEGQVITVRDHGIGIPEGARERVFQMFQRLHTREEYEGTGVGLALCRRIVERHGGAIRVEPVEGPGTALRFTLRQEA